MYEKYKSVFDSTRNRYILIGSIVFLFCLCIGYIFYQPNGTDYQRTINAVERAQEQQRKSVELNRSIQHSIDRSTELSHEAKGRVERSREYNQQINDRIGESQSGLSEARSYLKRNAELFDRIERTNRERQENH
nr:MAG TPA: Type II secretion system, protein M [Caudoviricetes sp.]